MLSASWSFNYVFKSKVAVGGFWRLLRTRFLGKTDTSAEIESLSANPTDVSLEMIACHSLKSGASPRTEIYVAGHLD